MGLSMDFLSLILLLSAARPGCTVAPKTCYNPDGTPWTMDAFQPCNQIEGVVSMCCGTNWTNGIVGNEQCLPSGLCLGSYDNKPLYWRDSCTDPTWKSPNCLSSLCTSPQSGGNASENVAVTQCADGSWCCGGQYNTTCCDNKLGVRLNATLGIFNGTSGSPSSSLLSTSTSGTATLSTTTLTTGTVALSPTSSADSATAPSNVPASPSGTSSNVAIGLGIGLGVLAVILALLCLIFWWRRRQLLKGAPDGSYFGYKSELDGKVRSRRTIIHELDANGHGKAGRHEVDGTSRPVEMMYNPRG